MCVCISCRWNVFTEPLLSKGRLFWLHYSAIQILAGDHAETQEFQRAISIYTSGSKNFDKTSPSNFQEIMPLMFLVEINATFCTRMYVYIIAYDQLSHNYYYTVCLPTALQPFVGP
jgi:hypothetical protein